MRRTCPRLRSAGRSPLPVYYRSKALRRPVAAARGGLERRGGVWVAMVDGEDAELEITTHGEVAREGVLMGMLLKTQSRLGPRVEPATMAVLEGMAEA